MVSRAETASGIGIQMIFFMILEIAPRTGRMSQELSE